MYVWAGPRYAPRPGGQSPAIVPGDRARCFSCIDPVLGAQPCVVWHRATHGLPLSNARALAGPARTATHILTTSRERMATETALSCFSTPPPRESDSGDTSCRRRSDPQCQQRCLGSSSTSSLWFATPLSFSCRTAFAIAFRVRTALACACGIARIQSTTYGVPAPTLPRMCSQWQQRGRLSQTLRRAATLVAMPYQQSTARCRAMEQKPCPLSHSSKSAPQTCQLPWQSFDSAPLCL